MAVSILSIECRPWRSLPALRSRLERRQQRRRRSASGPRAAPTGAARTARPGRRARLLGRRVLHRRPRSRGSASWRSPRDRRPAARRSRCRPPRRGRCRPARPPPRRAAAAATRVVGERLVQPLRPLLVVFQSWMLSDVGLLQPRPRGRNSDSREQNDATSPERACASSVTCKDRSVKTSAVNVCRPGALRITSRHLMCFSERRARLGRRRRARARAGGARGCSSRCSAARGRAAAAPLDEPFVGGLSFNGPTSANLAAVYWNPAALGLVRGFQLMVAGIRRGCRPWTSTARRSTRHRHAGGRRPSRRRTARDLQPGRRRSGRAASSALSTDFGGDRFTLGVRDVHAVPAADHTSRCRRRATSRRATRC